MESFPEFDLFPKLSRVARFISNLLSIAETPLMRPGHYDHPLDTSVVPVTDMPHGKASLQRNTI